MEIILLSAGFPFGICIPTNASSGLKIKDSLPDAGSKLTKTEFLQNYGKNDSSRALIRFFFRKRIRAEKLA